jgi:predicted nucleic acid-binding Zn finger protein
MSIERTPFDDALARMRQRAIDPDRAERAEEVKAEYKIVYVGSQCWVVVHPNDDERAYMVDMIRRHCTCPDYVCMASGLEIDCKHILAVVPMWEALTGLKDSLRDNEHPDVLEARKQEKRVSDSFAEAHRLQQEHMGKAQPLELNGWVPPSLPDLFVD